MKRILLYMLLTVSLAALAQQQATDDAGPADQAATATQDGTETAPTPVPADVAPETGDEVADGEDELPAPADGDFKPDEEISEDFPVPLPADI